MLAKKVLIVSDDQGVCDQLSSELRRNFLRARVTYNGQQALELLHVDKAIDIILLDIKLSDIDSLELLKQIKNQKPDIEVVMITDASTRDLAVRFLRCGAIDCIKKPINREEFDVAVGRAVEKIDKKKKPIYKNTILVIDDDKEMVSLMRRSLEKEGYGTFGVCRGSEAIEIVQKNKVDVVITDIKMSEMSGIEVLKGMKQLYQNIEVIIVTGHGNEELAVQSLRDGAIDYLRKPLNLDELLHSVEKALERINLYQTRLYRNREIKISYEITASLNEELERLLADRTTKLSRTQAQLIQAEKMAAIGQLASGVAHEVNNPLTAIVMNTAFLLDRVKGDEHLKKKLKIIEKEADRATEIVKGLLAFSRKVKETEKKSSDIHQIIEDTLKPIEHQLSLNNINIVRKFVEKLPEVLINANQIQQVFLNIINNARDAMPQGGELIITTDLIQSKKVIISFTDTGEGIPVERLSKIFDPFYTTKGPKKGTGLGLAVSYEIIKNHQGEMRVESEVGKGSSFKVILPV